MLRSVGVCSCRILYPPSDTVGRPEFGRETGASYRARSSEAIVDFPEPERPTIAVQELAGIVMDTSRRTGASGREGYRKSR